MNPKLFAGLAATLLVAGAAQASTFKTIYTFCTGVKCTDGVVPGSLTMDAQGNLYGTAFQGGRGHLGGTIFELVPNADKSAWTYVQLYAFCRKETCNKGMRPTGRLVLDTDGNLYGVTQGIQSQGGTVFELMPNEDRSDWKLKNLHVFCSRPSCADGSLPFAGLAYAGQQSGALYDGVSPLYGTTELGGPGNVGIVYALTRDGGKLREHVIHEFGGGNDGHYPVAPVIVGADGNLYGTAQNGGSHGDIQGHGGIVFQLAPAAHGHWTETVLYNFNAQPNGADGFAPQAGLLMNGAGHLFGTTAFGGVIQQGGTIFELTPDGPDWQHSVLYDFCSQPNCTDGQAPNTELTLDGPGNLLGTTMWGGAGRRLRFDQNGGGTVFSWSGTIGTLHDFCRKKKCTDGALPRGGLVRDAEGNLYASTASGGDDHKSTGGAGTIFMITP